MISISFLKNIFLSDFSEFYSKVEEINYFFETFLSLNKFYFVHVF